MTKLLKDMTLTELWQLFPICLSEPNSCWKLWYEQEKSVLYSILPREEIHRISHIGSTAIEGIWAKPIIDILIEIKDSGFDEITHSLMKNGYMLMSQSDTRLSFNKGYTEKGFQERVFHLHLRFIGDNDELYFRDYLNRNPMIAKEYEQLKLALWKQHEYDRDAYTDAKHDFVTKYTNEAKQKFKGRY
ncbi:MAG: GrpB family protein [Candidatus Izemoplasmatales bacterium]|nr:GrpB family protein [Candidatus Izemoplasmatales bacterium]